MSERVKRKPHESNVEPNISGTSDLVWGAVEIGREINRTPGQVYHLFGTGRLGDAVTKVGAKTLVGSRERLGRIFFNTD